MLPGNGNQGSLIQDILTTLRVLLRPTKARSVQLGAYSCTLESSKGRNLYRCEKKTPCPLLGCLHDTGATFAPGRVYSGSLSWLCNCLHDTTTKCHAGASHPSASSPRFLYRGKNFTPVRNFATVSCKRETTTRFGMKSVCR